jgi:hypothetical protein
MKRTAQPVKSASKAKPAEQPGRGRRRSGGTAKPIDPSLPLPLVRHEAFAQAVAKGMTADAAYSAAGYKPNRHNAARLNTIEHIRSRVAAIRAQLASLSLIDDKRALEILGEIVLTPVGSIDQHHMLCQEYSETPTKEGTAIRIKMPSKLDALRVMGTWCGWERGTQAEQAAARALGGVADMMARIRTRKPA